MDLWLLTVCVFLGGAVLAALLGWYRQIKPLTHLLAQATCVYSLYIFLVGLLVAFNLFQLDRIDPFFRTTHWHAFIILYWPSWVLSFAPLLISGTLMVIALDIYRARRLVNFSLLLLITLVALEAVFLLDVGVLGKVIVQVSGCLLIALCTMINRSLSWKREIAFTIKGR